MAAQNTPIRVSSRSTNRLKFCSKLHWRLSPKRRNLKAFSPPHFWWRGNRTLLAHFYFVFTSDGSSCRDHSYSYRARLNSRQKGLSMNRLLRWECQLLESLAPGKMRESAQQFPSASNQFKLYLSRKRIPPIVKTHSASKHMIWHTCFSCSPVKPHIPLNTGPTRNHP